ncbi:efflux RND transporter periplasmic adaptor subunit [Aurantiacibacter rhizosphaerae]|uniref:HlyD family efflux transporter periplasmic adaptor subunit n=1 Tax=Aurantiacibacter rhizosphaerae TaxID=2691582 RepID=A0A844XGH2_9SPHN|nr:HlyD family efflux transporter periplasmic adaptor subunit [Aurantiacibacter rhizosphaerae]MWV28625.1 HlyD family efflux transporter periplasmic adaptor subunit [Aurantiacibacter rhizosphaerae]
MSKQARWAILLLIGAVAIAALLIVLRPEPEEQDEVVPVPLVQTQPYEVSTGAIDIDGSGTVQPREEVTLGAEVAGRLVYVNPAFQEGSRVPRGAVLFRIDPADYNNRVRSAQADIAAQDVAVLQAREEMAIAEAELQRFAQRQSTREALNRSIDSNDYAARILPPEGLGDGRSRQGGADAAEPNILATREPQLRSARAARERAQAQLADARLALSRTVVRAPFAGIVRSEDASVGRLVQPGQSLGSMVASSPYEVRISLTEAEAKLVPALFAAGGTRVAAKVMLDFGDTTWSWNAYVDRVDPILDPETRTINVFLRVPDPVRGGVPVVEGEQGDIGASPPLLLGSFVSAAISGGSEQAFARIPLNALRPDNVIWVLRGGKLAIIPVEVLQRTDDFAYVTGDKLGDKGFIVTSPLRTPVDGMPLRTESEGASQ